jgi:hypothetical protein
MLFKKERAVLPSPTCPKLTFTITPKLSEVSS